MDSIADNRDTHVTFVRVENVEGFSGPSAELAQLAVENFGRRVRELRTARGYTQDQLARILSMTGRSFHQTTIAKVENGSRPTSVEELHLLAAILGVQVHDFFNRPQDGDEVKNADLARRAQRLNEISVQIAQVQMKLDELRGEYYREEQEFRALGGVGRSE